MFMGVCRLVLSCLCDVGHIGVTLCSGTPSFLVRSSFRELPKKPLLRNGGHLRWLELRSNNSANFVGFVVLGELCLLPGLCCWLLKEARASFFGSLFSPVTTPSVVAQSNR